MRSPLVRAAFPLAVLLLLAGLAARSRGAASPAPAPATAPAAEQFELRVKFDTPLAHGYQLKADVTLDQPFLEKAQHADGKFNLASGILLPPTPTGTYRLALTYIDWASDKENMMGATEVPLTLDHPVSFGSGGGIMHSYTVTLSRAKS